MIILELSSWSTFLLCFIHSWSPVKLWTRAVKNLALLERMERRVKTGKPLRLRDHHIFPLLCPRQFFSGPQFRRSFFGS